MRSRFRFSPGGRLKLRALDRLLARTYGAPEVLLGNQANSLDEAVYIILSFQTDLTRFKETWQRLKAAFQQWEDAEYATVDEISAVLRPGGLHRQKATTIKRLLRAVRTDFGELSLDALRPMSSADAERALTRLPGLSWKGARCVLLYSLNRDVFPVDGNTLRIFQRTGVIPHSAVYRRRALHDGLQGAVAPPRRRPFHVNLIVHGQQICLPQSPRCPHCPVLNSCPRRGLPRPLLGAGALPQALTIDVRAAEGKLPVRNTRRSGPSPTIQHAVPG